MTTSAYIHIPFCKSKCKYCSFVSYTNLDSIVGYVFSLLKDIDVNYKGELLKTLYFGGGTPSLLQIQYLKKIIDKFKIDSNSEVTIEVNPDDASLEYFKSLLDIGFNRLSLGSQTFNNDVLKFIGRRHDSEKIIEATKLAQDAGFNNISLDLIYGLPYSNIEDDLKNIIDLEVQHISTYGLKIEEGSFFYNNLPEHLPDEDEQAEMYLKINEILAQNNYKRYEISNFAKEGFESKHNLNYWNNNEYYGFGVAAHGYVDGIRYSNYCALKDYLENPAKHEAGHLVTLEERIEEEIFLGFRRESGINSEEFKQKFDIDFGDKYKSIVEKYMPKYIVKTEKGFKLTTDGILLSNNILSDFI